jgi:outer membrane protein assembly factor BamB
MDGTLYAVAEADGTLEWTARYMGDATLPVVTPTGVYVAAACHYAWDFAPRTGRTIWYHAGDGVCGGGADLSLQAGILYVQDAPNDLGGSIILDARTGGQLGGFSAFVPPAVGSGVGLYLSWTSVLRAIDEQTRAVLWSFSGDGGLFSAPLIDNGYVYIGSNRGHLYAIPVRSAAGALTYTLPAMVNEKAGFAAAEGELVVPASDWLVAYD